MDVRVLVAFCALCLPLTAECGGAKHGEARDNKPAQQHVSSATGGVFPIGTSSTGHSDDGAAGVTSGLAEGSTVDRTERETAVWVHKLRNFLGMFKKITADPEGYLRLMDKASHQRTKALRMLLVALVRSTHLVLFREEDARTWEGLDEMEIMAEEGIFKFEEALNEEHSALRQGMPEEPAQGAAGSAQPEKPSYKPVFDAPDDIDFLLELMDKYLARQDTWLPDVVAKLSHPSMRRYVNLMTAIVPIIQEMIFDLKDDDAILAEKAHETFGKARDAINEDLE